MLVLSRKVGQSVSANGPCTVTVLSVRGGQVRLGVTAEPEVKILRTELEREREATKARVAS